MLLPRFSLAISTGAAFLNGRGSDQSKRAISIPVYLNTRKSNFAMCDYTRARAHSTLLRSFAIMHAFTSIITRKWLALFTQYLQVVSDGVSLSMHCILYSFCTYSDNEINIMVQDGI